MSIRDFVPRVMPHIGSQGRRCRWAVRFPIPLSIRACGRSCTQPTRARNRGLALGTAAGLMVPIVTTAGGRDKVRDMKSHLADVMMWAGEAESATSAA